MPHPCVVCGRSRMNPNNREEEYMFFGFPVNYDYRCKEWLEFCGREDLYKLTKKQLLQRMVCSKHFERKDFLNEYYERLNCIAVPTIYDPKQSLYNITCVLCGRSRKDPPEHDYDGTTFHHFPGEEFRCLKWLDFVGIESYYRLTRKEILFCYICSNHFDKSQFVAGYRGRLIDNAVPNIRYPGKMEQTDQLVLERLESKSVQNSEKPKRYEPLSPAILESQACAACGRSRADPRNKIERYKFHPFPAYEIGRCLRWCQFLGREDLLKMSPNQIRKLVLCSKHFLTNQNFKKVGPCDAVPTIKDIIDVKSTDGIERKEQKQLQKQQQQQQQQKQTEPQIINSANIELENAPCVTPVKTVKRQDFERPLVSSKKPKIENKPTPLAKKRGRSKRPTSINIPKLDTLKIENRIKKLPLPPANWKIQIGNNQFQPLTIANTNNTNAITTGAKKVILPFTGNISNLGAPIPVHSLSSIPPGFLIKINLPDQEQKQMKPLRRQVKEKKVEIPENVIAEVATTVERKPVKRRRKKNGTVLDLPIVVEKPRDVVTLKDTNVDELIEISSESRQSRTSLDDEYVKCEELDIEEHVIEALEDEFLEMNTDDVHRNDDDDHVEQDTIDEYEPCIEQETTKRKRNERTQMSSRARRTLLPIKTEVKYFLHKLKPHMRRLPKKTRAQLKLSIVNMVIDRL